MGLFDFARNLFSRRKPLGLPPGPVSAEERIAAGAGRATLTLPESKPAIEQFRKAPWLFATVSRRAELCAVVKWTGRSRSSKAAAPQHPILDLLAAPLTAETMFWGGDQFVEFLSMSLDLTGQAVAIKLRNPQGTVVGLLPVATCDVLVYPSPLEPFFQFRDRAQKPAPSSDVIWICRRDPSAPTKPGAAVYPAGALIDETQADELLSTMARARAKNHGKPDLLLGIFPHTSQSGQRVEKHEVEALASSLIDANSGPENAGRMAIISRDFKSAMLTTSMVDGQYIQSRMFARDAHAQVFGMPPEILGILDNSNKSTIAAAADHAARYSTTPTLIRIRNALQTQLCAEMDSDFVLDFESVIPADKEALVDVLKSRPEIGTVDEWRSALGLPPLPTGIEMMASVNEKIMLTASVLQIVAAVKDGSLPKESAIALVATTLKIDPSAASQIVTPLPEPTTSQSAPVPEAANATLNP